MTAKLQMGFTTETRKAQQRRRSLGFSTLQFLLKLFTPCCKPKSLFLAFLQDFDHCFLFRLPRRRIKRELDLSLLPTRLTHKLRNAMSQRQFGEERKGLFNNNDQYIFYGETSLFFDKEIEKISDFFGFSSVNSTSFVFFFWVKFSKNLDIKKMKKRN